jgi:hypothetical protein
MNDQLLTRGQALPPVPGKSTSYLIPSLQQL